MNEAICEKIKLGLLLSKTNLPMSKAEALESCKIYFEIVASEIINDLLILEIKTQNKQKQKTIENKILQLLRTWLNRLALTKEAHLLIEEIKSKDNKTNTQINPDFFKNNTIIKDLINNKQNPTFKISTRNISISEGKHNDFTIKDFAKELAKYDFHKTDMHSPDLEFVILNADKLLLGTKIWENTNSFENRKAHLRPLLHPTAMNPKLARAMINIAGAKEEILDPFCGIGGILLEASLIGLNATGTDIDPKMITRAKLNLQNEATNKNIRLYELDALNWENKIECIITDLPYGKSSKLNSSITELIDKFLSHYSTLTKKAVLCFPKGTKYTLPENWVKLYDFSIYIHKSLTRNIIVLENQTPI